MANLPVPGAIRHYTRAATAAAQGQSNNTQPDQIANEVYKFIDNNNPYAELCRMLFGRSDAVFKTMAGDVDELQHNNKWKLVDDLRASSDAALGNVSGKTKDAVVDNWTTAAATLLVHEEYIVDLTLMQLRFRLQPPTNRHELLSLLIFFTLWVEHTACATTSWEITRLDTLMQQMAAHDVEGNEGGITAVEVRKYLFYGNTTCAPLTHVVAGVIYGLHQWVWLPRGTANAAAEAGAGENVAQNPGAPKRPKVVLKVPHGNNKAATLALGRHQHARFLHDVVKTAVQSWPDDMRFRVRRVPEAESANPAATQGAADGDGGGAGAVDRADEGYFMEF